MKVRLISPFDDAEQIWIGLDEPGKRRKVFRFDGKLQVQDLIDVLGELKAAGVQAAGIVTTVPGER